MVIWIVCWVGDGNVPGIDVFSEKDNALACLNYMMQAGKTAIVKTVNIQLGQEDEKPEDKAEIENLHTEGEE